MSSSKKSIIDWCNEQVDNGNELTIKWEGGGDSGWVYFEIDGDTVENEYTEILVNYMHEHLDYGSWAGEFSSNGVAYYSKETQSFEGDDNYSEDDHDYMDPQIIIRIPKNLWFDSFHLEAECYYDDHPTINAVFIVKNGFLTQEHLDFCHNLEEELKETFDSVSDNYNHNSDGVEFRGYNDSWIINRSDFTEEDGMLVHNIDKLEIQTLKNDDKSIVFELDEDIVNDINDRLNRNYEE